MLKNYESDSPLPNIFAAIEKTLSEHNAKQVTREYDNGLITAISFVVETKRGPMAVRLPAKIDKVKAIFDQQGYRYKEAQPYRTAWATIRDWVAIQMALIDWEMVKVEEVFLPYAVGRNGKTFFESFESGDIPLLEGKAD
jgi:hypothetical protein